MGRAGPVAAHIRRVAGAGLRAVGAEVGGEALLAGGPGPVPRAGRAGARTLPGPCGEAMAWLGSPFDGLSEVGE